MVCSGYNQTMTQSTLQIPELIRALRKRLNLSGGEVRRSSWCVVPDHQPLGDKDEPPLHRWRLR